MDDEKERLILELAPNEQRDRDFRERLRNLSYADLCALNAICSVQLVKR